MQWVQSRVNEMFPVSYFHSVFTLPSELNPFALRNKRVIYTILFKAVKDTLQQLALQDRWLGAKIGCIAVLHTWGQNIMDHPHLHCIIPAGGLRVKDNQWKHCKNDFFVPVAVLQQVYRGKFMDYFKDALNKNEIKLYGALQEYGDQSKMSIFIDNMYNKNWVVFIKSSFTSPQAVLNYLGNYTHRVALNEKRILSFQDGKVTFSFTDYRDENKRKTMTVSAVEFIRRFLLHILPQGFMRIRHFGLFANRDRTEHLNLCRKLLGEYAITKDTVCEWWEQILERSGRNLLVCSSCESGLLQLIRIIEPWRQNRLVT